MSERCPICDRPKFMFSNTGIIADSDDVAAAVARGECAEFVQLFDGLGVFCEMNCKAHTVDWRARALAAEAKLAERETP